MRNLQNDREVGTGSINARSLVLRRCPGEQSGPAAGAARTEKAAARSRRVLPDKVAAAAQLDAGAPEATAGDAGHLALQV